MKLIQNNNGFKKRIGEIGRFALLGSLLATPGAASAHEIDPSSASALSKHELRMDLKEQRQAERVFNHAQRAEQNRRYERSFRLYSDCPRATGSVDGLFRSYHALQAEQSVDYDGLIIPATTKMWAEATDTQKDRLAAIYFNFFKNNEAIFVSALGESGLSRNYAQGNPEDVPASFQATVDALPELIQARDILLRIKTAEIKLPHDLNPLINYERIQVEIKIILQFKIDAAIERIRRLQVDPVNNHEMIETSQKELEELRKEYLMNIGENDATTNMPERTSPEIINNLIAQISDLQTDLRESSDLYKIKQLTDLERQLAMAFGQNIFYRLSMEESDFAYEREWRDKAARSILKVIEINHRLFPFLCDQSMSDLQPLLLSDEYLQSVTRRYLASISQ